MKKRKRNYVQTVRRERQDQTRMQIVEALVALHEEIGPKNTTVAAVAARAGVQRLTVYRHFENEGAMLQACSSHWSAQNPPPQQKTWKHIRGTEPRVRAALLAIAKYYSKNHKMLFKVYRDASEVKPLAAIMNGFDSYFSSIADDLASHIMKGQKNDTLKGVARHLVRFSTWQSLSKENLSNEEIARTGWLWLKRLAV